MCLIFDKSWLIFGYNYENISPTWAASVKLSDFTIPAIATPYNCNGSILEYVCRYPRADKFDLVCQAINALTYIHSTGAVHGNVCPVSLPCLVRPIASVRFGTESPCFQNNICIADDGSIRVTDVGVDVLVRQTHAGNHLYIPSTWMYKPPEELESGARTTQADVY